MNTGLRRLQLVANALGGALFVLLFAVFLLQIAARFIWSKPLPWTDELAVVLYVWVILWACTFMVPQREHVAFDLLWNAASTKGRRVMAVLGNLLLGGLALAALPATWDYVKFMRRESTPVLDVPMSWVFAPFVALLISMVLRSAWQIYAALFAKNFGAEQSSPADLQVVNPQARKTQASTVQTATAQTNNAQGDAA